MSGDMTSTDHQFFPISFDTAGMNWITKSFDTVLGGGPGKSGVRVYPDHLEIRMATFGLDVPATSIRSVRRSQAELRGTSGVHFNSKGVAMINGCERGLVQVDLSPPLQAPRGLSTMFRRPQINVIVLSLDKPDSFIAAAQPLVGA
jgi:hypothetical protein